jgi:hypothetical protein
VTRGEIWLIHTANLLVAGSGIVYAVMRYLLEPVDEWAVVNHPWQPQLQHLHVLAAPLLVFAVGLIWGRHVLQRLRNGRQGRFSGVGLLVGFVPMAASGYLIQVATHPGWRSGWIGIHLAASALWLAAFAVHQARTMLKRKEIPEPAAEEIG